MKKQISAVMFLTLALVLAFVIMSCAPAPQNTNQATNAGGNVDTGSESYSARMSKTCSVEDINTEMNRIVKTAGIENQHNGTGGSRSNFKWDVQVVNGKNILIIEGGVSDGKVGNPSGNSEFMEVLIKLIDQLVERNCVWNAKFVRYGTIDDLKNGRILLKDVGGFDWSSCDWPNIPCPDGECRPSCPGFTGGANTNSNANANSGNSSNSVNSSNSNAKQP